VLAYTDMHAIKNSLQEHGKVFTFNLRDEDLQTKYLSCPFIGELLIVCNVHL